MYDNRVAVDVDMSCKVMVEFLLLRLSMQFYEKLYGRKFIGSNQFEQKKTKLKFSKTNITNHMSFQSMIAQAASVQWKRKYNSLLLS